MRLDTVWPALAIGVATVGIGIAIWNYEAPVVPEDRRYAPGAPAVGTTLVVVEPFLATRELADLDHVSSPITHSDPAGVEALIATGEAVRLERNDRIVLLELCGVEHSFARRAKVRTARGEFWIDAFNVMTPYRTRLAEGRISSTPWRRQRRSRFVIFPARRTVRTLKTVSLFRLLFPRRSRNPGILFSKPRPRHPLLPAIGMDYFDRALRSRGQCLHLAAKTTSSSRPLPFRLPLLCLRSLSGR